MTADALAEKRKPGTAKHLPFDHFDVIYPALDRAGVPKFEKGLPATEVRPTSSAGHSSLASIAAGRSPIPSHRIRARFVKGALIPAEPLDLPEGTEVSLDLRISLKD